MMKGSEFMFSFLENTDIEYVPYTKDDVQKLISEDIINLLQTAFLYLKKGEEKYIKTAIIILEKYRGKCSLYMVRRQVR